MSIPVYQPLATILLAHLGCQFVHLSLIFMTSSSLEPLGRISFLVLSKSILYYLSLSSLSFNLWHSTKSDWKFELCPYCHLRSRYATKKLKYYQKYSISLINIYFLTNQAVSRRTLSMRVVVGPAPISVQITGHRGKKLTFQRFFSDSKRSVKMDGVQYDNIVEEIYRNVGKDDIETRELMAVKRDILNRLNQSVSPHQSSSYFHGLFAQRRIGFVLRVAWNLALDSRGLYRKFIRVHEWSRVWRWSWNIACSIQSKFSYWLAFSNSI